VFRRSKNNKDPEYPYGQCTRAVYDAVPWVPLNWGDAYQWLGSAIVAGLDTRTVPEVGDVAVYPRGYPFGPLGHVALVMSIGFDGMYDIHPGQGSYRETRNLDVRGTYNGAVFIVPPKDENTRLGPGFLHCGHGDNPDPIINVMQAWDGLAWYWNWTAFEQAVRAGTIAGMFAGLNG
jgi:hypothetical protein